MKLIAPIKLLTTPEQAVSLLRTAKIFNEACDWLGSQASAMNCAAELPLHRAHYYELRHRFGLPAQMACQVIRKVCAAYKRDRSIQPAFRPRGAIPYDQRLYSVAAVTDILSILTLDGRIKIPFVAGDHQWELLKNACGQADLICRKGVWYLYVSVEMPIQDGPHPLPAGFLGVDLGVVNIATDSDGERHSGAPVEMNRIRNQKLRSALQRANTKSAKRHLKKLSGQEARFKAHANHVISKHLVKKAKDTDRWIVLEDLSGIRDRITVRKGQRARLGSWSFSQLRQFVTYKSVIAGVPLILVDPRNTSRTCPNCGFCDKRNRKSQSEFVCKSCGYTAHADFVGAVNIARKGSVNSPIVSVVDSGNGDIHPIPRRDQKQGSVL